MVSTNACEIGTSGRESTSADIWLLQDFKPLGLLGNLHPAPITDLAWSHDGRFLVISSSDGYCRWASCLPCSWPVLLPLHMQLHTHSIAPIRLAYLHAGSVWRLLASSSPAKPPLLGLMRLMDMMGGLCSIASFGSTELGQAATDVPAHISYLTAQAPAVSDMPSSSNLVGPWCPVTRTCPVSKPSFCNSSEHQQYDEESKCNSFNDNCVSLKIVTLYCSCSTLTCPEQAADPSVQKSSQRRMPAGAIICSPALPASPALISAVNKATAASQTGLPRIKQVIRCAGPQVHPQFLI